MASDGGAYVRAGLWSNAVACTGRVTRSGVEGAANAAIGTRTTSASPANAGRKIHLDTVRTPFPDPSPPTPAMLRRRRPSRSTPWQTRIGKQMIAVVGAYRDEDAALPRPLRGLVRDRIGVQPAPPPLAPPVRAG